MKRNLLNDIEESQHWKDFKQGNKASFEYLMRKHYDFLFRYGLSLHTDEALIRDYLQDFFLNLWETKEKLGEIENVKFYLFKSFRRLVLKNVVQARKEQSSAEEFYVSEKDIEFSQEGKMIQAEESKEELLKLKDALENLPARQKEAIHLKFYQKLDYQQISEMMEISYPSLRNLISQAIKTLRKNYLSILFILLLISFMALSQNHSLAIIFYLALFFVY